MKLNSFCYYILYVILDVYTVYNIPELKRNFTSYDLAIVNPKRPSTSSVTCASFSIANFMEFLLSLIAMVKVDPPTMNLAP